MTTKIDNVKLRKLSTNTMILNISIALRIRWRSLSEGKSRKPIAIGFAAWLIISQLCGGCKDTSKSDYSVKTMGSCNQQASIRIIDETNGITPNGIAPNSRRDASPVALSFKNYVNTISKYVFIRIDEMGACKGNRKDDPQVELVFIYRPLTDCKIAPFNFERTQSDDFNHLDSPWVKLSMSRSPKLIVRAAFLWSERQFLFDQAILSNPQIVPIKTLLPLESGSYSKFVDDYEKNVLSFSRKARGAAVANISKQLPADIVWLFGHSRSFTWALDPGMRETVEKGKENYINITKKLLNLRFTSVQREQNYQSVLDIKDVFNTDKYRIDSLY
jgi:hypothetical protein